MERKTNTLSIIVIIATIVVMLITMFTGFTKVESSGSSYGYYKEIENAAKQAAATQNWKTIATLIGELFVGISLFAILNKLDDISEQNNKILYQ